MERQISLWDYQDQAQSADQAFHLQAEVLALPGAEVMLYRSLFSWNESDRYFTQLLNHTDWRQDFLQIYGQSVPLPRLTAWYGDRGVSYTYSGIEMLPVPWTPVLLEIKASVEAIANVRFNSVLLNRYRTGQDSVAWHSDDEPELGRHPAIASVSFGTTRRFSFKHKRKRELPPVHLDLTHGSVLLMQGETQANWLHQVPKTTRPVGDRVNLTFRRIEH